MSVISAKIEDMKNMPWSVALVVSVSVVCITLLAALDKDTNTLVGAIVLVLGAFGYAELREIKSNTNGGQRNLMDQNAALLRELAENRRTMAVFTQQALDSPALFKADLKPDVPA